MAENFNSLNLETKKKIIESIGETEKLFRFSNKWTVDDDLKVRNMQNLIDKLEIEKRNNNFNNKKEKGLMESFTGK